MQSSKMSSLRYRYSSEDAPSFHRRPLAFRHTETSDMKVILSLGLLLSLMFQTSHSVWAADPAVLRIGYQKYGTLTILKTRQALEQRLGARGIEIRWTEFPAGPQMLEALNIGSIDFGSTGETPPIFAQAAGANLVYVAHQPPAPRAEAILVPKDSPLKQVADLKGKRVALNKGSNVHYLLIQALKSANLSIRDIRPAYLPPADARAAFERGSVDAWVIWDPYLAAAEKALEARTLHNGEGLVNNHEFYIAARPLAEQYPQVVQAIVEELQRLDQWAVKDPDAVAALLAPSIGLPLDVVRIAAHRAGYGARYLSEDVIRQQQAIADTFADQKLIPARLDIPSVVWRPAGAVKHE